MIYRKKESLIKKEKENSAEIKKIDNKISEANKKIEELDNQISETNGKKGALKKGEKQCLQSNNEEIERNARGNNITLEDALAKAKIRKKWLKQLNNSGSAN